MLLHHRLHDWSWDLPCTGVDLSSDRDTLSILCRYHWSLILSYSLTNTTPQPALAIPLLLQLEFCIWITLVYLKWQVETSTASCAEEILRINHAALQHYTRRCTHPECLGSQILSEYNGNLRGTWRDFWTTSSRIFKRCIYRLGTRGSITTQVEAGINLSQRNYTLNAPSIEAWLLLYWSGPQSENILHGQRCLDLGLD